MEDKVIKAQSDHSIHITSMRVQMFWRLCAVSLLSAIAGFVCIAFFYRYDAENDIVVKLNDYGSNMASVIAQSGYMADTDSGNIKAELSTAASIYGGRIIVVNGSLKIVSDSFSYEVGKVLISKNVVDVIKGNSSFVKTIDRDQKYAQLTIPIKKDKENIIGAIIVQGSLSDAYAVITNMRDFIIITLMFILIFVIAFAFISSKRMVRPLKKVTEGIRHAADGFMEEKLDVKGSYEIKEICSSFNALLSRLNTLENSRQEFVSNVSHELKTPMTSMKVLADSLNMQEDVPVEMYKEFMKDIAEEIDRENKIITDLLSLVRLDKKANVLNISQVDIGKCLEVILKRLKPLAEKANIDLVYESYRPVVAEVDETKLSLAIMNLVENAIKYNVEEGNVKVSLNADHKFFYVTVADTGIGIPEESQEKVFDRFYRVDKARSRETGGTGLGLAITRSIIIMHGGIIRVYSRENDGTTFTVRINLKRSEVLGNATENGEVKGDDTEKVTVLTPKTFTTNLGGNGKAGSSKAKAGSSGSSKAKAGSSGSSKAEYGSSGSSKAGAGAAEGAASPARKDKGSRIGGKNGKKS